jgi:hypothetical protein
LIGKRNLNLNIISLITLLASIYCEQQNRKQACNNHLVATKAAHQQAKTKLRWSNKHAKTEQELKPPNGHSKKNTIDDGLLDRRPAILSTKVRP